MARNFAVTNYCTRGPSEALSPRASKLCVGERKYDINDNYFTYVIEFTYIKNSVGKRQLYEKKRIFNADFFHIFSKLSN